MPIWITYMNGGVRLCTEQSSTNTSVLNFYWRMERKLMLKKADARSGTPLYHAATQEEPLIFDFLAQRGANFH